MSGEQAISVKSLRALFEQGSVQDPRQDKIDKCLPSQHPAGSIGGTQAAIGPTLLDDPRLEAEPLEDRRADCSSEKKPGSIIPGSKDNASIFETHPLSELDREIENSSNQATSPARPKSPVTEAKLSNTNDPTIDYPSPDSSSRPKISSEHATTSSLPESPHVSNFSDSMMSKSTPQMRPPRPPRPKTNAKPLAVDHVANEISSEPNQMTNMPSLPKRPVTTMPETPETVNPGTIPLVGPGNVSSNTRRSAPPPPARRSKESVYTSQERMLEFGRDTAALPATYDSLFQKLCIYESTCPVVRAGAVKMVWDRSGLPAQDLSYIWRTVTNNDPTCSCLTMEQFITGTRMIDEKLQRVPATLIT